MDSHLNSDRPPVFCPGCTHDAVVKALDRAFIRMGLKAEDIVLVTDIGCSGLLDTFFNTNAFHGTHGRALTYALGLKLAAPSLNVVVTMGDGGLGIGGAHFLAACRRNLDLTLIILNNLNFGMTGGQYSVTTPESALTASGFLNQAERPMDICAVAQSAGAAYTDRCSGLDKSLHEKIAAAISYKGFSILETIGICTGRFTRHNKLTARHIDRMTTGIHPVGGPVKKNIRPEFGSRYRELAKTAPPFPMPETITKTTDAKKNIRWEVLILGSAGMHVVTAGELLCHAGLHAGLNVSLKSDYNVTVLRGQCVSEVILSPEKIGYTGIRQPDVILALSKEGIEARKDIFDRVDNRTIVFKEKTIPIPHSAARIFDADFKSLKLRRQDWAVAGLALMARENKALDKKMFKHAVASRFNKPMAEAAMGTAQRMFNR